MHYLHRHINTYLVPLIGIRKEALNGDYVYYDVVCAPFVAASGNGWAEYGGSCEEDKYRAAPSGLIPHFHCFPCCV